MGRAAGEGSASTRNSPFSVITGGLRYFVRHLIFSSCSFQLVAKELTQEQYVERDRMINELKSQLRLEETRLALLKKLRLNQHTAAKVHLCFLF